MKKTMTLLGSILFLSLKANTLQAGIVIENPYDNVSVKYEIKAGYPIGDGQHFYYTALEHTAGGNYKSSEIGFPIDGVDISIIVTHPTMDFVVLSTKKVYSPNEEIKPQGSRFEDQFIYHSKNGKIIYTIDYTFAEKEGRLGVNTLNIKIVHAEVNGVELSKRGVVYKGVRPEL